jgi:RHS repeat-associated protein
VGVPIRNTSDYSPFGVQLDGRTIQGDFYRYGYQGSEKDDESKGGGNSYTTFFRQLDPRVGRWFSIDPKMSAWESPYVSMANTPITANDPKGDVVPIIIIMGVYYTAADVLLLFTATAATSIIVVETANKIEEDGLLNKALKDLSYSRGEQWKFPESPEGGDEHNSPKGTKLTKLVVGAGILADVAIDVWKKFEDDNQKLGVLVGINKTRRLDEKFSEITIQTDLIKTVEKGDNLTTIAKKYGTSVEQIVKWNKIEDPNKIYVGQEIKVVQNITTRKIRNPTKPVPSKPVKSSNSRHKN